MMKLCEEKDIRFLLTETQILFTISLKEMRIREKNYGK